MRNNALLPVVPVQWHLEVIFRDVNPERIIESGNKTLDTFKNNEKKGLRGNKIAAAEI